MSQLSLYSYSSAESDGSFKDVPLKVSIWSMYERNVEIPILNTCRRRSDLVLKHICVNKNFFCCRKKKKRGKKIQKFSLSISAFPLYSSKLLGSLTVYSDTHTHTHKKRKKKSNIVFHTCVTWHCGSFIKEVLFLSPLPTEHHFVCHHVRTTQET